jgi:FkbM family methyltransferase
MIKYLQYHGEELGGKKVDEVLRSYFPNKLNGVFFDVGAFEPVTISNSYHFEKNDWECYCFEANTQQIPLLKSVRKNVFNYAIADKDKDSVSFHVVSNGTWTAGFSAIDISEDYKKIFRGGIKSVTVITVPQKTLNTVIKQEIPILNEIDIISIDVEGGEFNVLKGLDLNKYKPKVMVIENVTDDLNIKNYLEEHGYKLDKQFSYNQYYVHKEYKLE